MQNISRNVELVKEYVKNYNGSINSLLLEIFICSKMDAFKQENDKRMSNVKESILKEFNLDIDNEKQMIDTFSSLDEEEREKLYDATYKRISELSVRVESELINCLILSHCKDDFDIYYVSLMVELTPKMIKDAPISDALRKKLNL